MDNVRWKVTDPLGNEIYLTEESFQTHIIKDHQDADAVIRMALEEQVKISIQNPCYILRDQTVEGRKIYLDWGKIVRENTTRIRPLFIVAEEYGKIVTWFSKRSVNIAVQKEGGIIYERRILDLQIRQKG